MTADLSPKDRERLWRLLGEHRLIGTRCRCGFDARLDYVRYEQHVADVALAPEVTRIRDEAAADAEARVQRMVEAVEAELNGASYRMAERVRAAMQAAKTPAQGGHDGR